MGHRGWGDTRARTLNTWVVCVGGIVSPTLMASVLLTESRTQQHLQVAGPAALALTLRLSLTLHVTDGIRTRRRGGAGPGIEVVKDGYGPHD